MSEDRTPLFVLWESIQDGLNAKIQGAYPAYECMCTCPSGTDETLIYVFRGKTSILTVHTPYELPIVENSVLTVFSMVMTLAAVIGKEINQYEALGGLRPYAIEGQARANGDDPTAEHVDLRARRLAVVIDGGGE